MNLWEQVQKKPERQVHREYRELLERLVVCCFEPWAIHDLPIIIFIIIAINYGGQLIISSREIIRRTKVSMLLRDCLFRSWAFQRETLLSFYYSSCSSFTLLFSRALQNFVHWVWVLFYQNNMPHFSLSLGIKNLPRNQLSSLK